MDPDKQVVTGMLLMSAGAALVLAATAHPARYNRASTVGRLWNVACGRR